MPARNAGLAGILLTIQLHWKANAIYFLLQYNQKMFRGKLQTLFLKENGKITNLYSNCNPIAIKIYFKGINGYDILNQCS